MKVNQLKAGVVLSYGTQVIHILTGLIYTPIMLRLLGQSEYGLYQLVQSTVSYLSLLSLGFGAGYMRFYSRYRANENEQGISKLNGMFMIIFSVIALISILCGVVLVLKADVIFGTGLTEAELAKSRILMAMMVFNMALSFINSVFTSNITAHERFFFQRLIEFLRAMFNPFLTLPLLIIGFGSIGMVAITSFLTIFAFVMNAGYCVIKLKIKFSFKCFDFGLLKEMWLFTFFIFINMIVDQINWSVDKFLLGRMAGTIAVAVYGVAGQLNSMYLSFSTGVSSVFIPRVNMMVAKENDDNKLTELFTRVGRLQFIIIGLIVSGYIIFGKKFIGIWAGDGYDMSYQIGLFLMIPVTIPLIQNLGIEIQRAKNMHSARSIVYLCIAVSNIFISIPCIKAWGAAGAAVGTAISLLAGNGLFMNVYYHKKIGLNMLYFWRQIARLVPAILCAAVIGILLNCFIPEGNIIFLGITIIVYMLVYCGFMWVIGMNEYEKNLIGRPIKDRVKGLCRVK